MRILIGFAILLLMSACVGAAESQPPAPSGRESESHQINSTEHPQKTSKVLPQPATRIHTSPPYPESQLTKNKETDESLSDWCLVILTGVLAFATYRLVVETRRLVTETAITSKRQAAETQEALNISRKSADAAQKSADVAEKAITLIERPYVFVFSVGKFHISEDLNPAITYEVANFGKTPAIVQSAHVALENIKNNLSAVLEVDRRHTLVSAPILSAGEVRKGIEEEIPSNMINFRTIDNAMTPDLRHGEVLFFRVIIHYRGPFTEGHESSFCWRYNSHTKCFEPYGHENYNYTI